MDKTVATFAKNSREQVRVALTEFHGRQLIDMRVFWSPDGGVSWSPGKKGLALGVEKLPVLLASLHQAAEMLGQDQPELAEEENWLLTAEEKAAICEEFNVGMEQVDELLSE
jgi:Transcriptional Coactivator p15 (PC4)